MMPKSLVCNVAVVVFAAAMMSCAAAARAQFVAANWDVTTVSNAGSPLPTSVVDNISDNGFHYVAQNFDRHVVSQLLSAPLELVNPGDKVTLSFNLKFNSGDATGAGDNALRYWIVDTTQTSNLVMSGPLTAGGGGGDGFAFYDSVKINTDGNAANREHTMGNATNINSGGSLGGPSDNLAGRVMRGNTGGDIADTNHFIGTNVNHIHLLEINVTLMSDGLYLLENNHTNVTNGTSFTAGGSAGTANERLVSHLWRDPVDDTLGFNGFAFTINNNGEQDIPFNVDVSNVQMTKTNIGTPGLNSNGAFHVDFLGRQDFNGDDCNACWIEQEGPEDSFTWAPFILQASADVPVGGFTNPFMNYADALGPGKDLTITVDVPKVEMNGSFSSATDPRLGINHLSVQPPDAPGGDTTGIVSLSLPVGTYDITSFHHKRFNPSETDELPRADISVTDADGNHVVATNFFPSLNNSGALAIGSLAFSVTSNGVDPVVITYTNVTPNENLAETNRDFPINGLIIAPADPASDGDYNLDGVVDAADYVMWRQTGIGGPQGYAVWQTNFGSVSPGSGGTATAGSNVPEPSTWVLCGLMMVTIVSNARVVGEKRLRSSRQGR